MANIEGAARAILIANPAVAAIVVGRVHMLRLPQGVPLPALRLQVLSDQTTQTLEGFSEGDQDDGMAVLQVGVVASSFAATQSLCRAVQAALESFEGPAAGVRWDAASAGPERWNPFHREPGADHGVFEKIMEFTVLYSGV